MPAPGRGATTNKKISHHQREREIFLGLWLKKSQRKGRGKREGVRMIRRRGTQKSPVARGGVWWGQGMNKDQVLGVGGKNRAFWHYEYGHIAEKTARNGARSAKVANRPK